MPGVIDFPRLEPTGDVDKGTKITLRYITKFKTSQYFNQREFVEVLLDDSLLLEKYKALML